MDILFAPLEGITTATFRRVHGEMFGECDKYYAPFITPIAGEKLGNRAFRDILPEKNPQGLPIPQILTSSAEAYFTLEEQLMDLGYTEANLNFGCPSQRVVKKGRGAGVLRDLAALDRLLEDIFSKNKMNLSVKTRTGFLDNEDFLKLLEVYNRYPMEKLIVHPRCRAQFYTGRADLTVFDIACKNAKMPLCYNGDIFSKKAFDEVCQRFPNLDSVMLGRGAIKNPAIFREIKGGAPLKTEELLSFTQRLYEEYMEVLKSPTFTLHKLKEIWFYMMWNFPEETKILKTIKKASHPQQILSAIECLPQIKGE